MPRIRLTQSLVAQLLVFALVFIIVGGLLRHFTLERFMRDDLVKVVSAQQEALARDMARNVDYKIVERRRMLEQMAASFPLSLLDAPKQLTELTEWLRLRHDLHPIFTFGLFVARTDGVALVDYPRAVKRIGTSYADRDYMQAALAGQFSIGRVTRGRAMHEPVLPMAIPLKDASGKVRAVLAGITGLNAPGFLDSIHQGHIGETGGYLLIAPKEQIFIAASKKELILQATARPGINPLHDRALQGVADSGVTVNAQGIEEIAAVAFVPSTGWFVVARLPTKEALALLANTKAQLIRSTFAVYSVLMVLLGIFLWFYFQPLKHAAEDAQRMALGDVPLKPLPVKRPDEIGYLVVAFNSLLAKLQHENALRLKMIESIPGAFYVLDHTGSFLDWNDNFLKVLEYDKSQMASTSALDLFSPDDQAKVGSAIQQVFETGSATVEAALLTKSGRQIPYHFNGYRLEIDGQPCLIGIGLDMTEHQRSAARLQLAASVFTNAREAITITDVKGHIVDVNDSFTRITGYARNEVLGQNPRMLKSGRHPPEFFRAMWYALTTQGYWSGEMWNRRKDGEFYAVLFAVSAVRDAAGATQNYVALFSDITSMKERQRQIEYFAYYDALTDLPNRVLLEDRLQQALVQSQRRNSCVAVAYLDLDGFKEVNDQFGHTAGDELLIALAKRMKSSLRGVDTLSRLGGDEFVAIIADLENPQACQPMLERLLQAAAQPVAVGEQMLSVSASIGVTVYPQDAANANLLLQHADQAMYQAKQGGKNRYCLFTPLQAPQ